MASIRTASIAGLALLTAVALAGCSPSSDGPASSGSSASASTAASAAPVAAAPTSAAPAGGGAAASAEPKACELLTADGFRTATGHTVKVVSRSAGQYDSCAYMEGNQATGVLLARSFSEADFEKSVAANPGKPTPVSDVGDEADSWSDAGNIVLAAWHSGVEVAVTTTLPDSLTKEKALATAALSAVGG